MIKYLPKLWFSVCGVKHEGVHITDKTLVHILVCSIGVGTGGGEGGWAP